METWLRRSLRAELATKAPLAALADAEAELDELRAALDAAILEKAKAVSQIEDMLSYRYDPHEEHMRIEKLERGAEAAAHVARADVEGSRLQRGG